MTYKDLKTKLKTYMDDESLKLVDKAYKYAEKKHFGQKRLTGEDYINHPIVNDPVYGNYPIIDETGQMLHAKKLDLIHPRTKEVLHFESDLPEYFTKKLDEIKNN